MTRFPALAGLALLLAAATAVAGEFRVTSPDLDPGGTIAREFVYARSGCTGANRSPALQWSHSPQDTQSFAITVHDPGAPRAGGWWHWIVHGIPARVRSLPTGASGHDMPAGAVETKTSFSERGYGGPCPPPGDPPHHYVFTVYALGTHALDVPADADPADVADVIARHAIDSATLTARYGR